MVTSKWNVWEFGLNLKMFVCKCATSSGQFVENATPAHFPQKTCSVVLFRKLTFSSSNIILAHSNGFSSSYHLLDTLLNFYHTFNIENNHGPQVRALVNFKRKKNFFVYSKPTNIALGYKCILYWQYTIWILYRYH